MPQPKGSTGNPKGRPKGIKNRKRAHPELTLFCEQLIGGIKEDTYYIYKHEYKNECFYVGKGKGSRAWDKAKNSRNTDWENFIKVIDHNYTVRIIALGLNESEALVMEAALINLIKPKCNIIHNHPQFSLKLDIS